MHIPLQLRTKYNNTTTLNAFFGRACFSWIHTTYNNAFCTSVADEENYTERNITLYQGIFINITRWN